MLSDEKEKRYPVSKHLLGASNDPLNIPLDEFSAPLFQALLAYQRLAPVRFHMPGHKGGPGYPPEVAEAFRRNAFGMDVTETRGMDNLHLPSGVIRDAQDLAARTFGADHTFFLTNGTTAGVHAMIMTTCKEGQKIIIPRDAHLSVIGGVILCGLVPVFVYPKIDPEWGISLGIPTEEYERALRENPDVKACLITRPNYYGIAWDLRPLAELCHAHDIPLLVDEAHGAHIHLHPALPQSAVDMGADMVVQSTHKMLGSFTGSSMLHTIGNRIPPDRVQRMLAILQSTSPSYLLMVSLDIAATVARMRGHVLMSKALELAAYARERLSGIDGLRVLDRPGMDSLKLTLSAVGIGLAGYELKARLMDEFNVRVELADFENVIAFITYADTKDTVDELVDAVLNLVGQGSREARARVHAGDQAKFTRALFAPAERVLLPRQATLAAHELINLSQAEGRVCAEVVAPYPPGIPLLYPGEVIDRDHLDVIDHALQLGAVFRGLTTGSDGGLVVTVVRDVKR
jgi:arginine decarboxylase